MDCVLVMPRQNYLWVILAVRSLGSDGQNQIFDNDQQEIQMGINNETLSAENNWWGTPAGLQGSETTLFSGSQIDATPFLKTKPSN